AGWRRGKHCSFTSTVLDGLKVNQQFRNAFSTYQFPTKAPFWTFMTNSEGISDCAPSAIRMPISLRRRATE
ncbi:MAG TPA: hypothetical protein VGL91_13335, partial [Acidobacteriota bacterium]